MLVSDPISSLGGKVKNKVGFLVEHAGGALRALDKWTNSSKYGFAKADAANQVGAVGTERVRVICLADEGRNVNVGLVWTTRALLPCARRGTTAPKALGYELQLGQKVCFDGGFGICGGHVFFHPKGSEISDIGTQIALGADKAFVAVWLRTDFLEDTTNALGNGGLVLMKHDEVLKVDDTLLSSFNSKAFYDGTDDFVQFGAAWQAATDKTTLDEMKTGMAQLFGADGHLGGEITSSTSLFPALSTYHGSKVFLYSASMKSLQYFPFATQPMFAAQPLKDSHNLWKWVNSKMPTCTSAKTWTQVLPPHQPGTPLLFFPQAHRPQRRSAGTSRGRWLARRRGRNFHR